MVSVFSSQVVVHSHYLILLTQADYLQQGIEVRERNTGTAPSLGLALAGGGTKAADFSLGILQGLTESGVMEHVDAVSTVSGGSYAGLWYFSRLLNQDENLEEPLHAI